MRVCMYVYCIYIIDRPSILVLLERRGRSGEAVAACAGGAEWSDERFPMSVVPRVLVDAHSST